MKEREAPSAPAALGAATGLRRLVEERPALLVFVVAFVGSVLVQGLERFYYYGDSWSMLHELLAEPRGLVRPHNEWLMPLFKGLYYAQYRVFGASHVPLMVVGFALHAGVAALVFRLGVRAGLARAGAAAAALLFTFSSVPWEVTGWSFEQCIELATLFGLGALLLLTERPHAPRRALGIGLLSLLSLWSGPVAATTPLYLTAFYGLVGWRRRPPGAWPVLRVMLAIWGPVALYFASLAASAPVSAVLGEHQARFGLGSLLPLAHYVLYGVFYGLVQPTLTLVNTVALGVCAGLLSLVALWRLRAGEERRWFLFLAVFVFLCSAATGLARAHFGPEAASASRYQYLPGAALAILLALAWQPLARALSARGRLARGLGVLTLCYLVGTHVYRIRHQNPSAERGLQTQAYLRAASASLPPSGQGRPLGSPAPVPAFVYAPGAFPLWAVQQVLEVRRDRIVPVEDFLLDKDGSWAGNELPGGAFEGGGDLAGWRTFGGASMTRAAGAALHGAAGLQLALRGPASAVSRDVVHRCPERVAGRVYSWRAQVRTRDGRLRARLVFKDAQGRLLASPHSAAHPGDGAWHSLSTGGLAPEGTCVVGVDVVSAAVEPTHADLDDAVFISHPRVAERGR